MTRTKPTQDRGRDRVEQILRVASELIASPEGAAALTTTAVAERMGVSVATVYRYFKDRYEIVVALLNREIDALEGRIDSEIAALEIVTLDDLVEIFVNVHLDYFQANDEAIVVWHDFREGQAVMDRVSEHYTRLSSWVVDGTIQAGLIVPDAPKWPVEAAAWLCDQAFGMFFREGRSPEEQRLLVVGATRVLKDQVSRFGNPAVNGVPLAEFLAAAGRAGEDEKEQTEPQET